MPYVEGETLRQILKKTSRKSKNRLKSRPLLSKIPHMKEIPLPILPETAPEDPSSQLAGFSPLQGEFLLLSVKLGLFSQLDERSKKLIIQRATTTGPLDSLRDVAGVTTRERVRQIIVEGLRTIHEKIPPEFLADYWRGVIDGDGGLCLFR